MELNGLHGVNEKMIREYNETQNACSFKFNQKEILRI